MLTLACVLIGGGIGGLIGAAAMTTEKGKEINENMENAWSKHKDELLDVTGKAVSGWLTED